MIIGSHEIIIFQNSLRIPNLFCYSSVIGAAHSTESGEAASPSDRGAKSLHTLFTAADGSVATIKEMKMNRMLCGYLDDPRQWDEPEAIEEENPLTITEQQIEWLCDDWKDALVNDSFDEWYAMQMQIYGAKQMLVNCAGRFNSDVYRVLDDLGNIAFENGLECIREGKYEGAPA